MRNDVFVKRRMQQVIREELARTDVRNIVREAIASMDLRTVVREQLDEFYGPPQQRRTLLLVVSLI